MIEVQQETSDSFLQKAEVAAGSEKFGVFMK